MELNGAETIKQDSNKENHYFLVKAIILTNNTFQRSTDVFGNRPKLGPISKDHSYKNSIHGLCYQYK